MKEEGGVQAIVRNGSLNLTINNGNATIAVSNLIHDSKITIVNGNFNLRMSDKLDFKLKAIAPSTNIDSKILNKGEFKLNKHSGLEEFETSDYISNRLHQKDEYVPTLYVSILNGTLNIINNSHKMEDQDIAWTYSNNDVLSENGDKGSVN